jgi:short-subunit dehydrogenase
MLSRLYLPLLRTHEKSYILNVGSMAAFWSIPYKSLYSSSKAFVVSFSKSIRSELKGSGVSVSVLCPNGVRTNGATHGRINSHGRMGRLTELSADVVARAGINGMLKEKFIIVPGRVNSFVLMLGRFIPTALEQRFLFREFEKEIQEASKK